MRGRDERAQPLRSLALVLAAALAAAVVPGALLLGAPLALGAPHLVADVRYGVFRRRLPAALLVVSALAVVALVGLRAVEVAGRAPGAGLVGTCALVAPRLEALIAAAWLASGVVTGAAASIARVRWARVVPFLLVAAVLAVAPTAPTRAAVVLLHNVVALALWIAWFRPARRTALAVVAATAVGAAGLALVGPAVLAWLGSSGRVFEAAAAVAFAPGVAPRVAAGVLQAVLFLQLVHYATWLVLVPAASRRIERARGGDGAPRARHVELGVATLVALTPLVAALALTGSDGPRAVRDAYLSLGIFHAYLELAVWAFSVARGDVAPAPEAEPAPERSTVPA